MSRGAQTVMQVSRARLDFILDWYHRGKMLRAYEAAREIGPLAQWQGPGARVMAGRLAMNLGAPRLGRVLHELAHREAPDDPESLYYCAMAVVERRGPVPAWELVRRHVDLTEAPDRLRADWFALRASILGWFRDFETAEQWMRKAEELAPERAWIRVERSNPLAREDRYVEALQAGRRALELLSWYRPGVQCVAHLLQLLDRDEEALAFLRSAAGQIESGPVVCQLAMLEMELGLHEQARQSWERAVELSPLAEKGFQQWLSARRSDAAYLCGDRTRAADLLADADSPQCKEIRQRLCDSGRSDRRVMLPVGFVRQHHMTCGPATLSALSRFWSMPAEHLGVAEEICYDGTPAHSERRWAEQNGFVAREFTVTWDSAVALIDRGIPFTFTTVEPTSAHLQSVIGYDALLGTLLIRDPFLRSTGEWFASRTFDRYKSTGPRGMLMVPRSRAESGLLDGLELPDVALYDAYYELQRALAAHDREGARTACESMIDSAPRHRLTLWARRALASYDANVVEGLQVTDELLELFPDDPLLQLSRLSYLRILSRREDRLALLKRICDGKGADPVFLQYYAQELKDDAREDAKATWMVRRALRHRRLDAAGIATLAELRWVNARRDEALDLYRFAACLADKDEGRSRTYLIASRHLKKTSDALQWLSGRFAHFGDQSGYPARSLFWAFEELNRNNEGFGILDEALRRRPSDGDLLLYAAHAYARHGRFDRAKELLESARGKTQSMAWLRGAAYIAGLRGEPQPVLIDYWRRIISAEPLALDAHRMLARLLAETESPSAALAHLEQTALRFPHNYPLTQLWLEWAKDEGAEVAEPIVRRLVAIHPADAWSRRELVWVLLAQHRDDEALAEAEMVLRLDPSNPSSHYFHGLALAQKGRLDDARAAWRAAISHSVDADFAIARLIDTSATIAQKKESLDFVRRELVRQTIFGDGLLAYRKHARHHLDAGELLALLREALEARPDLWHAWSAVMTQLGDCGRPDEALELARQACERFPLLPRIWLDRATVHRFLNDSEGELASLNTALEISPGWGQALRQLCDLHERNGDVEISREIIERAIRRAPLDPFNYAYLADALWKLDDREGALEHIQQAVRLDPGYDWGWAALRNWSRTMKRPELAEGAARQLTERRPGEARSWMVLARVLQGSQHLDERLAALSKSLERNPRLVEAYDLRAELLTEANRYDDALSACNPPPWGGHVPTPLLVRAAIVQAARGDLADATARIKRVIDEDPNNYSAWDRLTEWRRRTRDKAEYLKSAQMLRRLRPFDVVPMGYLGEAMLWSGDRAGARRILGEALERFPDYRFGAATLFTLEMEDGIRDAAAVALDRLRRVAEDADPELQMREVQFNARFEDSDAAGKAMGRLVRNSSADAEQLDNAFDAMSKASMFLRAVQTLREALPLETVAPAAGMVLVRRLVNAGRIREARLVVQQNIARGDLGHWAADAFLAHLAQHPNVSQLRRFVRSCRAELRRNTPLWGQTSYALFGNQRHRAVVRWLADWRQRPDAEAWMLVNLTQAMRALGRHKAARPVHMHAIALPANARVRGIHHLWLALEAALAADSSAATLMEQVPFDELRIPHQFLYRIVEAVQAARQHRPYAEVHKLFRAAHKIDPAFRTRPEMRRTYRLVLRKLLLIHGGLIGRFGYLHALLSS